MAAVALALALAAAWAGPAAAAGLSGGRPAAAATAAPARVKYYVVPPSGKGATSLIAIAAQTLGSGSRFTEIFNLNKGRPQQAGGRLENPSVIEAGWVLQLPADASGPGVHFGPLPGAAPAASSPPPSPRPSPRVTSSAAAGGSGLPLLDLAGAAVVVLGAAWLAVMYGRRRRGGRPAGRPSRGRPPRSRPGLAAAGLARAGRARPGPARPGRATSVLPRRAGAGPGRQLTADEVLRSRLGLASRPGPGPGGAAGEHPSWPGTAERGPFDTGPLGRYGAAALGYLAGARGHYDAGGPGQHGTDPRSRDDRSGPGYPPWPDAEYPSQPGASLPGAGAGAEPGPPAPAGYPGRPGPSGYLRRPAQPGRFGPDHPSWPATDLPRVPSHAADLPRAPGPATDLPGVSGAAGSGRPDLHSPGGPAAGPPARGRAGYPDQPGGGGHLGRFGPDHPSWPATDLPRVPDSDELPGPGPDYPRWPGAELPRRPRQPGGPGPGGSGPRPGDPYPAGPGYPGPSGPGYPGRSAGGYPGQAAGPFYPPGAQPGPPGSGSWVRDPSGSWTPAGPSGPGWPAQLSASQSGPGTYEVSSGDVRFPVVLTDVPAGRGLATGLATRPEAAIQLAAAGLSGPLQAGPGTGWNADSLRLAERILSGAEQEAARIRQEAAELRQQATRIQQEATDKAAATVAAAEQEAAELRAAASKMSAELGEVAAYVTQNLAAPAKPGTQPASRPASPPASRPPTAPSGHPATKPAARPSGRPARKPAARPSARPARKPPGDAPARKAPGRQVAALRKMVISFVLVALVGTATGITEIALHGFAFFAFRANGAGASVTGLTEDQGPGQPNAPGTHHKPAGGPGARPGGRSPAKRGHAPAKPHSNASKNGHQPPGQRAKVHPPAGPGGKAK